MSLYFTRFSKYSNCKIVYDTGLMGTKVLQQP